jgi:UDP-glucose 4-epimerase
MAMTEHSNKTSCLVIGGGGYIGSYLVPLLTATGRRVTILGRKPAPNYPPPENAQYVQGSFSELALIQRLLDENKDVIHLAYATVPNTSYDNPLGDLLGNLPPTVQLFSEAATRGNRLVFVSSGGTVYGEALSLPITEDHPTRPISPYGVTKLTLERYAFLYAATHGLKVICIRPSNAYGIGQRPFMGQGFIATAIASALQGKPITIYGERGTIRDYIHVADLASGITAALERAQPGETFNLGSGTGRSNADVLEAVAPLINKLGRQVQVEHKPPRSFDVKANVLDSTALERKTGWAPRIAFEEGLSRTCGWLQLRNT